jgi:hypothetical protein
MKRLAARVVRPWLCLIFLVVHPTGAQTGPGGGRMTFPQPPTSQRNGDNSEESWSDVAEQQKRQKLINAARQKSIQSDTEKLLKLASALKAETESPNSGQDLPLQMNQWSQIERLARSIKDRMSYVVPTASVYNPYSVRQ